MGVCVHAGVVVANHPSDYLNVICTVCKKTKTKVLFSVLTKIFQALMRVDLDGVL